MKRISIYDVEDTPVGSGGMGTVYRGYDQQGNRVAIKEMRAEYVADKNLCARFHQETKMLGELEHQSIVKMYASFEEHGNLYLVMEFVEGETIEQYVRKHGHIAENEAIEILREILPALSIVHKKGYVHRDIKPSNIMLRTDREAGKICLLDFGIAKDLNRQNSGLTTVGQMQIGTVGYMSPEQVEGNSIDHRTDIYSLGCVLFYMLTGHHAIAEKSNNFKTQMSIITDVFPKAQFYNPKISDNMQRILDKATAKNMLNRFQSCRDFEAKLASPPPPPPCNPMDKGVSDREIALSKQLSIVTESNRKNKITWIMLLIICIASCGVMIYLQDKAGSKNQKISAMQNDFNSLEIDLKKQRALLSDMRKVIPLKIDKIELGNYSGAGNTMYDDYGSTLHFSRMRYLRPKIYYTSFFENSKAVPLYYKIYNPDGSLKYNTSDVEEDTKTIFSGSNSTTLSGRGDATTSVYSSGTYRIEIWYNNMCLRAETFKIN